MKGFDAVIFDLDGVITQTALVHSAAWSKMFNEYLQQREQKHGEKHRQFNHQDDYLPYVDGKPRYKGVASFLESRNIDIPFGAPDDSPEMETACGLGNRKNQAFNEVLDTEGVKVYESTVDLLHELKDAGKKIGVASSSKNCKTVLEAAGLIDLFETRVDGVVSAELGLHGKPEPDIFTTACDNLGVEYDRAVVVEDAVSGVQAGAKGNFGLTLGIAREDNHRELLINGADIVVSDISDINGMEGIVNWFENQKDEDSWHIRYRSLEYEKEKSRESLLTIGNGYFGTRGTMEEMPAGEWHYPGTYIAGLYNRLKSPMGDRQIENEDFVNIPNWLPVQFKINDGQWITPENISIHDYTKEICLKNGLYERNIIGEDKEGNIFRIRTERFSSMDQMHLGALKYVITPLNFSGEITIKSGIDAYIINDGVARYRSLNQKHIQHLAHGSNKDTIWLESETTQSKIRIAQVIKHRINGDVLMDTTIEEHDKAIYVVHTQEVAAGSRLKLEKTVAIFTSKSDDSTTPLDDARKAIADCMDYFSLLAASSETWENIWQKADIKIEGDRKSQRLLRLHAYHVLVSASPNNEHIDASITARGLHGEAYRGHIFWDELFILPFYDIHFKKAARSILMYRYRRLDKAREYAKEHNYTGAMFPWQSGSDGREETQIVHLNPLTGKWGDDYSSLQRHVGLAIALNIIEYFHITEDADFLSNYGMEMLLEISRFWACKAYKNDDGRYSIKNVMGPDEFHEHLPGSDEGGLKDNAYTNLMVAWLFEQSIGLLEKLSNADKEKLFAKIQFKNEEISKWEDIRHKLNLIIDEEGIIAQFDGYFELDELDWDYYRNKYGNIYRMDRLLKAEGKSADSYKVAKQADTLMTFYNLDQDTVTALLKQMGYKMPENYLIKNLVYYLERTSHGSTLSRVVHAKLASMTGDEELSWKLYSQALESDFVDIQGGTTAEGIHAGVMAGTLMIALNTFAGIDLRRENLQINPKLPKAWKAMSFKLNFKGLEYQISIDAKQIKLKLIADHNTTSLLYVNGKEHQLSGQDESCIDL